MTSKTPSKPASEQLPTLSPQLLHRGKPRYTLEALPPALHSLRLLCSRLLSSHPSESSKPILISLQLKLLNSSEQLDVLLTSLSEKTQDSSSQEDPQ